MEVTWVQAAEWPEKVASLTAGGWWLSDLCALDTVGLYAPHERRSTSGPLAEGNEDSALGGAVATGASALDTVRLYGDNENRNGHRFEIVTQWLHRERRERMSIHVPAEGEPPTVPSIVETWPEAAFMEREAYDLMGIVFDGHEGLARLLMPEHWEGHPLRKDYGVGKIPIQWVPQPTMQVDSPGQAPDPAAAGQAVDQLGQSPHERADAQ